MNNQNTKKPLSLFSYLQRIVVLVSVAFIWSLTPTHAASFGAMSPGTPAVRDMTEMSMTTFIGGEDGTGANVVDTTRGYMYQVTYQSPARLVKIRLSDSARISAVTLPSGNNKGEAIVIDEANQIAYIGLRTSPAKVAKVDLVTMTHVSTLTLPADAGGTATMISTGDMQIDTTRGFVYATVIGDSLVSPKVYQIRTSDFTIAQSVTLNIPSNFQGKVVTAIDVTNNMLYAAGANQLDLKYYLFKVDLSTMTQVNSMRILTTSTILGTTPTAYAVGDLLIDPATQMLYVSTVAQPLNVADGASIEKVNLSTFTIVNTLTLPAAERGVWEMVLNPDTNQLYAFPDGTLGKFVRIDLVSFTRIDAVTFSTSATVSTVSTGTAVLHTGNTILTIATDNFPVRIYAMDIPSFTKHTTVYLRTSETDNDDMALDSAGGFVYYLVGGQSGSIVKVDKATNQRVDMISLQTDASSSNTSIALDAVHHRLYVSVNGGEATADEDYIEVIDTTTFTIVDRLMLGSNSLSFGAGTVDSTGTNAYFATCDSRTGAFPKVTKVQLQPTLSVVETSPALNSTLTSSASRCQRFIVLDEPHNAIYTSPRANLSELYKLTASNLQTPAYKLVIPNVNPVYGWNLASTAVLDSAHNALYIGMASTSWSDPALVAKIDISPAGAPVYVSKIESSPEGKYYASALDAANGILYMIAYSEKVNDNGHFTRIRTSDFTKLDSYVTKITDVHHIFRAALDPATGYIYGGLDVGYTQTYGRSMMVNPNPMYMYATRVNLTEITGVVNSVRMYSHKSGNKVRLALYDNAKNLLWQSGEIVNPTDNAWIDVPISSGTPSSLFGLPAGGYWLAYQTSTAIPTASYLAGSSGSGFNASVPYGSFPTSFPAGTYSTENYAMNVVYTGGNVFVQTYGTNGGVDVQETDPLASPYITTSGDYSVRLTSAPVADVTITITPHDGITTNVSTLTFTPANWNVNQWVTVNVPVDGIQQGAHTGTISHTITTTDPLYATILIPDTTVNIKDSNPPIAPSAGYANTQINGAQFGLTSPARLPIPDIAGGLAFSAVYNDPDAGDTAFGYQLQISTTSDFTGIVYDSGANQNMILPVAAGNRSSDLTAAFTPVVDTQYYWHVRFTDEGGNTGAYSAPATFGFMNPGSINPVTVAPGTTAPSAATSYQVVYTPPTNIDDHWFVNVVFPPEIDISALTPADIVMSGTHISAPYNVSFDTMTNTARIEVQTSGGDSASSPITITVNNLTNPVALGTYTLQVQDYNTIDTLIDQGAGSFTIAPPVGLIDPVQITPTSMVRSAATSYQIDYTPPTALDNHWNVKLEFPAGIDLSAVTAADVTMSGTNIGTPYGVTVDNTLKTILIDVQTSGASSGPISLGINNITNPSTLGNKTVTVSDYDNTSVLVDQGTGTYTITSAPAGIINPVTITPASTLKSASTRYDIVYTPPTNINDHWTVKLTFPSGMDLSTLTAADVQMSGTHIGVPYSVVFDNTLKTALIDVQTTGGDSANSPITITVNNLTNPSTAGNYSLTVADIDTTSVLVDEGTGSFTITNPVGTINPVNVTPTSITASQASTYQTVYTPPTNIDDHWKVKLTFPSGMDLSTLTAADVQMSGTHIGVPYSVVFDNTLKTALIEVQTIGGDSANSPITIAVHNLTNPSLAGNYSVKVGDYDAASYLIDEGTGSFTIMNPVGTINPVNVTPSAVIVSSPATYTTVYTPPTNIDDHWKVKLTFPSGMDLSTLTAADVQMSGTHIGVPYSVVFDNTLKTALIEVKTTGGDSANSPITIAVQGLTNPSTAGNYTLKVEDYNVASYLIDEGTGSFTLTVANTLPGAPAQGYSNSQAATAQMGNASPSVVSSTPVVFSGIYVDADATDTSTKYRLQIATDALFGDLVIDTGAAGTSMNPTPSGARSQDLLASGFTPVQGTTYYWRLAFFDDHGQGEFSTAESLQYVVSTPVVQVYSGGGGGYTPRDENQKTSSNHASADMQPQIQNSQFLSNALPVTNHNTNSTRALTNQANDNINRITATNTPDINSISTSTTRNTTHTLTTTVTNEKIPYVESVCSTLNHPDQVSHISDINDPQLQEYVQKLIKKGVAFDITNDQFNPDSSVARSELLRYIVQTNCEDFKKMVVDMAPFPDVQLNHKDALYITLAKLRKIVSGYIHDGTYKPENSISRAEALKIIIEVTLGDGHRHFDGRAEPYTDIDWNDQKLWYKNYLRFAYEKGIITLSEDKHFRPNDPALKSEIVFLLHRALMVKE